jgi:tyrosinase
MEATGQDVANAARVERDDIVHRKNAGLLSDDEVAGLRTAWEQIKQISVDARGDDRGFFEHAGQHGVPYWRCPHHTPQRLFLPWHRAYLYRLEQSLRDRVESVTLPWWDWTTTRAIPPAFAADGSNTLGGSQTLVLAADVRDSAPLVEETSRATDDPANLPGPADLEAVMDQPSFAVFSDACEGLHDGVHVWVGGTMGNISYAAFDPVFWAHHCMIDRIWWLWQQQGRMNAVPFAGWEDQVLEPFNMTVRDVLDANALGLDYADSETLFVAQAGAGTPGEILVTDAVPASVAVPAADFRNADFEIGGIKHTGSSWEGLVYLDNPAAGAGTGKDAAAGYVGSFTVLGHGGCFGAAGHCDAPDERRRFDNRLLARSIRMKKRVDVSDALRAAARAGGDIQFTIVAKTSDAKPEGVLDVKRLSVVTYR